MPSSTAPAAPDITTLDRSPDNATAALYRAAIGPINTDYYLPVFARFEAAARAGPSWNWAASLYTLNWMIFRHLWSAAVLYLAAMLGLLLLVFGVGRVLFQWSAAAQVACLALYGGLSFVLPGVFGNAVFHASSRQLMAAALSTTPTLADACQRLSQQASSRQRFLWLVSVNLALASLAAVAYVAWPVATLRPVGPVAKAVTGRLAPPVPMGASSTAKGWPAEAPGPVSGPARVVAAVLASSAPVAAPAGPRYLINVGLFANEANARAAYAKLHAAGLAAFTQTLNGRTRVRVGPFASQSEAQAAAEQIHALQLHAVVFQP